MMPLQSFELRDHRLAGRDQRASTVWKSICHEDRDKPGVGKSLLGPVIRSGCDQVANHHGGLLDAPDRYGAAMGVAEQKTTALGKLSGNCSLGDTAAQEEQQGCCGRNNWTHGNLPIQYVPP